MTKEERITVEKRRAAELAAAYARVAATDDGRLIGADLMSRYDPARSRFGNDGVFDPDAMRACFRDGQSSVVNVILEAVKAGQNPTNETHL